MMLLAGSPAVRRSGDDSAAIAKCVRMGRVKKRAQEILTTVGAGLKLLLLRLWCMGAGWRSRTKAELFQHCAN